VSYEMEQEDFVRLKDAEIAALREQTDNLVAMICAKDREITSLTDRLNRMTVALDDALGIVRGMRARDEALKAELEALEL
jgi:predicted RNase H-like nuclease (RuvC/YqgF family)